MAHSYVSALFHCVFSTKERRKLITDDLQERLWPYTGGIARENKMKALAIGGIEDHVHLLLSIPSTLSIAKVMQLINGGSSKWVHDTFPEHRKFEWQEGYGAFSIGISQVDDTKNYIANQREHHRTTTFQEEFIAFLERHGIEYDPRYVWGRVSGVPTGRAINLGISAPAINRWAIFTRPFGTEHSRRSRKEPSTFPAEHGCHGQTHGIQGIRAAGGAVSRSG